MSKYKIRFSYNQIGLMLEQFLNGEWRCVNLWNNQQIESLGGIFSIKNKCLLSIRDYELVKAGLYHEKDGSTVNCI